MILVCLAVSAACSLSPSAASTSRPTPAPQAAGTPVPPVANPPATSLPLPATPTSSTGRSAGIDLSGSAATAAPNVPPTLAPQAALHLVEDEWYPSNVTESDTVRNFSATILGWGIPKSISVGEATGDQKGVQAKPGYHYVRLDLALYNGGREYLDYSPISQLILQDDAGNNYDQDPSIHFIYEADSPGNSNLAPGEHLRQNFYFTIPDDAGLVTLRYDICASNDGACGEYIYLPLNKIPDNAQPPAEFTIADQGTHPMSEVQTVGDLAFSVIRWQVETPTADPTNSNRLPGVNLVGVTMLIANQGTAAISTDATSGIWVSLKDHTGWYFPVDNVSTGWGGQIEPGEWMQVYYAFQAPPGVAGLELVIDTGEPAKWPVLERTFVSLGDQPALDLSPIEQMPGSIAPNPIPLGQAGAIGPFQISVQKVAFPNTSACGDIPAGYKSILVTASGINTSSEKKETYALQTYLKDSHGNQFSACNTENDSIATSGLDAGATMNLVYSFLVPDFGGDVFLIEKSTEWDSSKIFFALK
jgi:hypothetical protein